MNTSSFEDEAKYSNDESESVNDLTFTVHSYSDGKQVANENLLANNRGDARLFFLGRPTICRAPPTLL